MNRQEREGNPQDQGRPLQNPDLVHVPPASCTLFPPLLNHHLPSMWPSCYHSSPPLSLYGSFTIIPSPFPPSLPPSCPYPSPSRMNLLPGRGPEENYISQEVCTSVIYEAKGAVRRAETVSRRQSSRRQSNLDLIPVSVPVSIQCS